MENEKEESKYVIWQKKRKPNGITKMRARAMYRAGIKPTDIAKELGFLPSNIYAHLRGYRYYKKRGKTKKIKIKSIKTLNKNNVKGLERNIIISVVGILETVSKHLLVRDKEIEKSIHTFIVLAVIEGFCMLALLAYVVRLTVL